MVCQVSSLFFRDGFICNLRIGLFFPVERLEGCVRVNPTWLLGSVDNERGNHHNKRTDNQYGEPYGIATGGNLAWRDEAQHKCKQLTTESQTTDEPHQAVAAFADAERAVQLLHLVAQGNGSGEHQHVHDEIKNNRQL